MENKSPSGEWGYLLTEKFNRMNANVQTLFEVEDGKSKRQKSYEELYVSHGVDFDPIFEEAHKLTLVDATPEIFRGRGYMAYHMNWNLLGLVKERFKDKIEFDKYGRMFYPIDSRTRVYFKKLNDKYAPDNVTTDHVRELNSMSMFYGEDSITVLYAGFKISEQHGWHELQGCYLVEMKTLNKPNWVSDISELSYEINKSLIYTPITTIHLPDELVLKPKKTDANLGKISGID